MPGYSVTFTVVDNATKQIDQINRRLAAMRAPMERMSRTMSRFVDLSGLRKVADGFNWIGRAAGYALGTLTAIVPVLGAITSAATIAGMTKLVSSFAQWGNQLRTNADQIGITTDELQKWQDATTRAGGSAQDLTETLKNLHGIAAEALTGRNAEAYGMFRKFGIDITDANGKLKTATQLLPEVFRALDSLTDPADRSRVAATLLGDAQAKLYEEYKQSGKPLADWLAGEEKHQRLTEQQLEQLNRYRLAQASLGLTFDQLGRQVSAVLANNFTPLLQHLDEFVQKHTPEIVAAIDQLSKRFADWLEHIDWQKVEDGVSSLLHGLEFMVNHLDDVVKAAEAVAAVFAIKWGVGMVADIVAVTRALGTAAGAIAGGGGTGLLGALASIAAIAAVLALHGDTAPLSPEDQRKLDERNRQEAGPNAGRDPADVAGDINRRQGYTGNVLHDTGQMLRNIWGHISGTNPQEGGNAPLGPAGGKSAFYDEQRQLIYDAAKRAGVAHPEVVAEVGATQATLESGGGAHTPGGYNVYGIKSGGGVGTAGAPVSTQEEGAGGRYTTQASFAQFKSKEDAADAYVEFLKRNPRHYQAVLDADTVEKGLHAQGTSGYATASNYESSLYGIHRQYGGAAAPPPAAPVNGSVNVDITHRNAPPDATVTARGSGSVNVNGPRVEHPQLDFSAA